MAPCEGAMHHARMLQLVAAPRRRAVASEDRATRCYVTDRRTPRLRDDHGMAGAAVGKHDDAGDADRNGDLDLA
jgi:hypothetical protein